MSVGWAVWMGRMVMGIGEGRSWCVILVVGVLGDVSLCAGEVRMVIFLMCCLNGLYGIFVIEERCCV